MHSAADPPRSLVKHSNRVDLGGGTYILVYIFQNYGNTTVRLQ